MAKSSLEILAAAKEAEDKAVAAAAAATQKVINHEVEKAATELEEKIKSLIAVVALFPDETKFTNGAKSAVKELAAAMGAGKASDNEGGSKKRTTKEKKKEIFEGFLRSDEKDTFILSDLTKYAESKGIVFKGSAEQFFGLAARKEVKKTTKKDGVAVIWKKV
jgi:hypothetical protein